MSLGSRDVRHSSRAYHSATLSGARKERSGQMSDALVLALLVVGGLAFFFAAMTRFMGGLEE